MSDGFTKFLPAFVATAAAVGISFYMFNQSEKKNSKSKTTGTTSGKPTTNVFPEKSEMSKFLCSFIANEAKKSISERGVFYLAVAGGSLLDSLVGLVDHKGSVDFSKVVLCFANHKCVDPDSENSNLSKCKTKFADAAGITNFIAPPEPSEGSDGNKEASKYAGSLLANGVPHKKVSNDGDPHSPGRPVMDLVLLGLGADGHVGSCHPMGPAVLNTKDAITGSPKVGEPSSITLTIETMNAARVRGVVVSGGSKGKKEAVKRAQHRPAEEPRGTFPAQLLDAPIFFLDAEAAADL